MKRIVRYFFILVLLCSSVNSATAGFWVKSATHTSASASATTAVLQNGKAAEVLRPAAKVLKPLSYYHRSYRQSEWVSIGAMVLGMLGLFIPGVNLLAILFGVLAMGRGGRVKGLAIAGFVMGILELILYLIAGATFVSLILL